VNPDILFAQMMHETGYLKFGGDVNEEQNNFAGLGAVGNGAPGESFPSIRIGIRAVVQHLKAYASTEPLKLECVDSRFKYVQRGSANYVEHLGIKENPKGKGWAAHQGYGYYLLSIIDQLQSEQGKYSVKLDSFNVEGEFVTGQPINLSATGNMQSDTMYKFAYRDDSTGEWTVIQDYSSNNKATFTPNKTGSYRFVVHVKHKKSLEAYDDFGFEDKIVAGKGKVTSFNVTGNMITGSTINISANA
ncbi:N-acetylmuramoyl-L-alanine amidase, partial [Clostridium perfringens]|nr:N-acetylmuramoyl-L-alanine amidase [Clostridium perfringens]